MVESNPFRIDSLVPRVHAPYDTDSHLEGEELFSRSPIDASEPIEMSKRILRRIIKREGSSPIRETIYGNSFCQREVSPSPRSSSDVGVESHAEEQKWKLPRYNAAGYRVDHGCGRRPPPTADHGYMSTYYVSPHEQMHPVDKRVRETSQDTQPDEKNQWTYSPPCTSQHQLQEERKQSLVRVDPSFDLDGDGIVDSKDYYISRIFDQDQDGRLNQDERSRALQAISDGKFDHVYLPASQIRASDNPPEINEENVQTRSKLLEERKTGLRNQIIASQKKYERLHHSSPVSKASHEEFHRPGKSHLELEHARKNAARMQAEGLSGCYRSSNRDENLDLVQDTEPHPKTLSDTVWVACPHHATRTSLIKDRATELYETALERINAPSRPLMHDRLDVREEAIRSLHMSVPPGQSLRKLHEIRQSQKRQVNETLGDAGINKDSYWHENAQMIEKLKSSSKAGSLSFENHSDFVSTEHLPTHHGSRELLLEIQRLHCKKAEKYHDHQSSWRESVDADCVAERRDRLRKKEVSLMSIRKDPSAMASKISATRPPTAPERGSVRSHGRNSSFSRDMTFVLLAKQGKPFPGNESQNYTEFDGPLFSSFHSDGAIPESALMSPRHLRRMKRVQNRALLKSGQLLDKQHQNHSTDQREAIDTDLAAGVSLIPRLPLHALSSSQARVSESMSNRPSYSASRLRDFNGERDALSSRSSSVRFAPLPLDDMTSIPESPVSSRASTSLSFRSSALMSPRSRVAVSQEIFTESASSQAISSLKLRPATTSSIHSTTNRSSSTYGGDIQSPPHTSRESTFQRTFGGESLDYSASLFSARTPLTDRLLMSSTGHSLGSTRLMHSSSPSMMEVLTPRSSCFLKSSSDSLVSHHESDHDRRSVVHDESDQPTPRPPPSSSSTLHHRRVRTGGFDLINLSSNRDSSSDSGSTPRKS